MKLNNGLKWSAMAGNWLAKVLLSLAAIAFIWQGSFFVNSAAMAVPTTFVATTPANQVQGTADEIRDRSKDFIQDTKRNVEKTANRNASKVDQADDDGSFVERKAQRDRNRIARRAEEDASRTEKAVDNSMNAVQGAVESIKEAFGG